MFMWRRGYHPIFFTKAASKTGAHWDKGLELDETRAQQSQLNKMKHRIYHFKWTQP